MPKVAIIYLCYKNLPHLSEVVLSWEKLVYPKESMTITIVPAGSPDGIADVVRRDVLPRSGKDLPEIILWDDGKNEGFAKNNNAPMRDAIANGAEYIFLQNGELRRHLTRSQKPLLLRRRTKRLGASSRSSCIGTTKRKSTRPAA